MTKSYDFKSLKCRYVVYLCRCKTVNYMSSNRNREIPSLKSAVFKLIRNQGQLKLRRALPQL